MSSVCRPVQPEPVSNVSAGQPRPGDGVVGLDVRIDPRPPYILLSAAELPALAASAQEAPASAFAAQAALLIQAAPQNIPPQQQQQVRAWLMRQPCPVIAIGDATTDPWQADYDVLVPDLVAAQPLLANIKATPQAAAVLVQTLRLTAQLPVEAGLIVESLAYASLQAGREFQRWLASHQAHPDRPHHDEPAVVYERLNDHLDIRLNRPQRRNAFSVELRDALMEPLQLLLADETLQTASLRGNGRCFSSGGDLDEFGSVPDPASGHLIRSLRLPSRLVAQLSTRLQCHLHGACIGAGIELPAFCQQVVAHEKTYFQLPELRFGLIPGAGGCVSLPRRIGRQRTAWLALSGRRLNARTALAWGLVDELVSGKPPAN